MYRALAVFVVTRSTRRGSSRHTCTFTQRGRGAHCLLQNELTVICVECREVGAVELIHWKTERGLLSKEVADRDQSRKNHQTMGKGRRAREREGEREKKREREKGGREGRGREKSRCKCTCIGTFCSRYIEKI